MVSMRAADEDGILDGTFKDHGQTEMTVSLADTQNYTMPPWSLTSPCLLTGGKEQLDASLVAAPVLKLNTSSKQRR